ncbi:MAG: hypothetical protein M5T52_17130 [Ignavibacteriaceae bacterium]|nr:hypothetical protein [Ignavibacteriaceae bacterium]
MFKKITEQLFGQKTNYRALELPITLRVPLPNEVPMDETVLAKIKKSETAKIVEGYTIKIKENNPEHSNLEFEFYSEINIDNSRLWKLFNELTYFLPNEVTLLSGHIDDEEINYGTYSNKTNIIDFLNNYEKELTSDTFLKFGLLFHSENQLTEVFVDETKYIKFWGSDRKTFEDTLNNFGLKKLMI